MLLNTTRQTIIDKFNIKLNNKENIINTKYKQKQKNKKTTELDEIYTVEHMNIENNNNKIQLQNNLNIPIDKEINTYLPNINNFIEIDYTKNQKPYNHDIKLDHGFPSGVYPKQNIKIIIYQINHFNTLPFIMYLLYKNNINEDPDEHLILTEIEADHINIKSKSTKMLNDVIFKHYDEKPQYKGYREYKNEYYLFFEHSPKEQEIVENIKRNSQWVWAVVYELIDTQKILNFPIRKDVTDFFLNNFDVNNIYTPDNTTTYEMPITSYHGSYYKKTKFISVFGITRATTNASLGPFYYFAPYDNAVRYAMFSPTNKPETIDGNIITVDEQGRYEKGGLVRFVIFTGKMKIFDDIEQGFIQKSLITTNHNPIIEWREKYNSVFTGLYNKIIEDKPVTIYSKIVIKQYEQQIPLTYHFINTNTDGTDFGKIKIE